MSRAAPAQEKLDRVGLDEIVDMICDEGMSLRGIAAEVGVSPGSLLNWLAADGERSARVRETRRQMAVVWDEKAEDGLAQATDEFELKKAKELAHHYRWRARATAPLEYGDQVEVRGHMTLEQLVAGSARQVESAADD